MKLNKMVFTMSLVLLISVLVTACGGNDNTGIEPTQSKTVTDGRGKEVVIPVKPERIAALNNMGDLTVLGVHPIASIDYYLDKFEPELVAGIESVGSSEPNLEKLSSLDPDLIIVANYMAPEGIEALEKIAPVFATEFGLTPFEQVDKLADVLDLKDEEKAWHDRYEARAAEVREQLKPYVAEGATAVVLQFWEKNIYQHHTKVFSSLYDGAGFVPTENARAVESTVGISEEAVAEFVGDADYLFLIVEDTSDKSRYDELRETVWKNTSAVKNDQVYLVENARWNDYSGASLEWVLDDLVQMFVK